MATENEADEQVPVRVLIAQLAATEDEVRPLRSDHHPHARARRGAVLREQHDLIRALRRRSPPGLAGSPG